ncbi:MAG: methyltransferase domain-containing protein [Bryobacterales bacterium]|nr:methyltransferase domain-containing protein [Bryobacterales bacterium]
MPSPHNSRRYLCNVCGAVNDGAAECKGEAFPPCTGCGSTVRQRGIVLLLSRALFGCDLALCDFPELPAVRGLGVSDPAVIAKPLAKKFSYTNTYYHREPSLDITGAGEDEHGRYDFIICSEVLEHVAPPVEAAFAMLARLLRPGGFVILTVPYSVEARTVEHFDGVASLTVTSVGGKMIAVGRDADGSYRLFEDLVFHVGEGSTLERRMFCEADLAALLTAAGFAKVTVLYEGGERFGVAFAHPWSLPVLASHGETRLPAAGLVELAEGFAAQGRMLRAAGQSKWVKLGRAMGLGPKLG